jgi:hypothetical protein
MDRNELIEVRSSEVQEIISRNPSWMLQWGVLLVFFVLTCLFTLSWFVRYPDVITASISFGANPPGSQIISRTHGKLVILKREFEDVFTGELIGYLESNISIPEINRLEDCIKTFQQDKDLKALEDRFRTVDMDEFQDDVTNSLAKLQSPPSTKETILIEQRIAHLEKRIDHYKKQMINLGRSNAFMIERQIDALEHEIIVLQIDQVREKNKTDLNISITIAQLLAIINQWKEKYHLNSPADGKVTFANYLQSGQLVHKGTLLFSVLPLNATVYANAELTALDAHNITVGQELSINIENDPTKDFSSIRGRVTEMYILPKSQRVRLHVSLHSHLQTKNRRAIDFYPGLEANGKITTRELRVFDRIFYQLKSRFNQAE